MPSIDCSRFRDNLFDIDARREVLKQRTPRAEIRLEQIRDRQGEIRREIAEIGLTLPSIRFRPRRA